MKTEEDEAFEAIERRQGGFQAKRAMAADKLQEPAQEAMAHPVIAGALYDFMGWLTSRKERIVLSSADNASPAADAIRDFANMRDLSLYNAQVETWREALAQPAQKIPYPVTGWKVEVRGSNQRLFITGVYGDTIFVDLPEAQPAQEPVAYVTGMSFGRFIVEPLNPAIVLPVGMALYSAPQGNT